MNRKELIQAISAKGNITNKAAKETLDTVIAVLSDALAGEERITLPGFGTFEVKERGPRVGRNPQTGETIKISASKTVSFKIGSTLKSRLN